MQTTLANITAKIVTVCIVFASQNPEYGTLQLNT